MYELIKTWAFTAVKPSYLTRNKTIFFQEMMRNKEIETSVISDRNKSLIRSFTRQALPYYHRTWKQNDQHPQQFSNRITISRNERNAASTSMLLFEELIPCYPRAILVSRLALGHNSTRFRLSWEKEYGIFAFVSVRMKNFSSTRRRAISKKKKKKIITSIIISFFFSKNSRYSGDPFPLSAPNPKV